MRTLIVLIALAVASPSSAQSYLDMAMARDAQTAADALAVRNRDVALTNEFAVLQARVQSEQSLSSLAAARATPSLPRAPFKPGALAPMIDIGKLAAIPDASLAQSNARVRAAADNRR